MPSIPDLAIFFRHWTESDDLSLSCIPHNFKDSEMQMMMEHVAMRA